MSTTGSENQKSAINTPEPPVLYRGNRTEVLLLRTEASSEPFVTKRLLGFADVSPERKALFREALVQHTARGPGVVPILGSTYQEVVTCEQAQGLRGEARAIARVYIDGLSLREVLSSPLRDTLSETTCRSWAGDLCLTLNRVHRLTDSKDVPLGLVHRDVNAGNILIEQSVLDGGPCQGHIWLNDF